MEKMQKREDRTKKVMLVVSLFLVMILLGALMAALFVQKDGGEVLQDDVGSGVIVEVVDGEENGIRLTAVTKILETGAGQETVQQVTATLHDLPDDTKLDWSIAWKSTDGWASGKDIGEYLTATPTADGALTVNVKCLQAFGAVASLKAAVRGTPSITATADVKYQQKYAGTTGKLVYTNSDTSKNLTWNLTGSEVTVAFPNASTLEQFKTLYGATANTSFAVTTQLGTVYTDSATVGAVKVAVAPTAQYRSAIAAAGGTIATAAGTYVDLGSASGASASVVFSVKSLLLLPDSGVDMNVLKSQLRDDNGATVMLNLKVTTTVNGKEETSVFGLKFDPSTLASDANLTLEPGSIMF